MLCCSCHISFDAMQMVGAGRLHHFGRTITVIRVNRKMVSGHSFERGLNSPLNRFFLYFDRVGIMINIKAGVPRTAYAGVVTVNKNGVKLHIYPSNLKLLM